jgi:molecular chaperone GrpE
LRTGIAQDKETGLTDKHRSHPAEDSTLPEEESSEATANAAEDQEEASTIDISEGAEAPVVLEAPIDPTPQKLSRKQVFARLVEKNDTILKLTKEKTALENQLRETHERWVRAAAEFENYRKRSRKEWDLLKQQTKAEVVLETLSVVDDFERAFSVVEETDSKEFVQGIRLIYNNLAQSLLRLGVTEIESHLEPFDPNLHMAVGQIDRDDVEPGLVAEVVQKGYRLDDVVVRPARVIVAK